MDYVKVKTIILHVPESDYEQIRADVLSRAIDINLPSVVNNFYADLFQLLRKMP
jgi:hypothetical protein